jgi:hypothetical protein
MAEAQVTIYPCTYEDKTFYEDDFDRESGRTYYTKYSQHEYRIKVQKAVGLADSETEEYVFELCDYEEPKDMTIDKLKELTNGTYNIQKYSSIAPDLQVIEHYYETKLTRSESQACILGTWLRDGPTIETSSNIRREYSYKNNKAHGWEKEYRPDETIERLFQNDVCLGHRIIKDGVVVHCNISEENLAKF